MVIIKIPWTEEQGMKMIVLGIGFMLCGVTAFLTYASIDGVSKGDIIWYDTLFPVGSFAFISFLYFVLMGFINIEFKIKHKV